MGIEEDRVPIRRHKLESVVLHAPEVGRHRNPDDRVRAAARYALVHEEGLFLGVPVEPAVFEADLAIGEVEELDERRVVLRDKHEARVEDRGVRIDLVLDVNAEIAVNRAESDDGRVSTDVPPVIEELTVEAEHAQVDRRPVRMALGLHGAIQVVHLLLEHANLAAHPAVRLHLVPIVQVPDGRVRIDRMVMEMISMFLRPKARSTEGEQTKENRRKDRREHGPCGGKEGGLNHGVQVS